MSITHITVRGARQHNLRDISVQIPRNTLTVVTGLSGSGKSSLAFDTIYAEGQRRYVETLSAYARQFLDQIERPDVDSIEGLSPAISIEQKTTSRSPRSTVGTITEIYDYLRLLYASVGSPHCPNCGKEISRQSAEQIVERILALGQGERVTIYAPIVRGRKGEFKDLLDKIEQQGFRARIDGELRDLSEPIALEKRKNHTIEAAVYRAVLKPGIEKALEASVAKALQMANGLVLVATQHSEQLYSSSMACPDCGLDIPKLEPRSFSFNSTYGACPECHGLGSIYDFDPAKIINDWSKPLLDGALGPGSSSQYLLKLIKLAADRYKIDLKKPFDQLTEKQQELLLYGPPKSEAPRTGFHGILAYLRDSLEESKSDAYREWMMQYMSASTCPVCKGRRLRPESLAVKVGGLSIADFTALPLNRALDAARAISFSSRDALIAERLRREVVERLEFLVAVGLSYLALDRNAATLSGGEGQRIRLATQIGSHLRGVLYVLDEPSIGLHQRDNQKLIVALESLRDLGNTVLVVEHDEDTIRRADYVLDLGPGAGKLGGHVVAEGTPAEIMGTAASLTGRYLSGETAILHREAPRPLADKWITVEGARSHNLKDLTAKFPLGIMTVVTGVSGSGKSTLVNDILYRALAKELYGSREEPGEYKKVTGFENIDKAIRIDQSPIGRTPRSNPATYTGVFTAIRDLFAMLPESRERGYKAGRFSFNVAGGRCEACQGDGQRRIEMNFLPDVYVQCEVCNGRRYNHETLAVKFNGYSIADILDLAIEDALPVLADIPQVKIKLQTLVDVGLGYIHLGQAATTLSGGEAQRMKLARELSKRQTGRTLYLLDEPTTGLHFDDVRKLLEVLHRLTDLGNTILIIEHNLDVIRNADWLVDLGPEGGEGGGQIIAEGTPEQVAQIKGSHTGEFLKRYYEATGMETAAPKNAPKRRKGTKKDWVQ
ncbi:excinuclease ABC subunit UvrA [Silvibacterium dinghuense]|uniref:UvrABC system protein A n=1 Tax=Silvibacterium dinghuense TaxID=1560006 RepID=A0A4Q1SES7_9BACT|nr:excinuclease ABC subunit UvrA [Silvibacterium dinghuense]RXS95438.1 excinuclease ABC subunit UvrA [Silvibacterium dinghuense]GGH13187.1 UvrABC system protein A [Silvibacterium dinghuense]